MVFVHSVRPSLKQSETALKCVVEQKSWRPSNCRRIFSPVFRQPAPMTSATLNHITALFAHLKHFPASICSACTQKYLGLWPQWSHSTSSYTTTATMAARIHLVTIDPRSTVALTQTCRALEVPVLSAVWEIQSLIKLPILSVLSAVACCYTSYAHVGHLFSSLGNPHTQSRFITEKYDDDDDSLCRN